MCASHVRSPMFNLHTKERQLMYVHGLCRFKGNKFCWPAFRPWSWVVFWALLLYWLFIENAQDWNRLQPTPGPSWVCCKITYWIAHSDFYFDCSSVPSRNPGQKQEELNHLVALSFIPNYSHISVLCDHYRLKMP